MKKLISSAAVVLCPCLMFTLCSCKLSSYFNLGSDNSESSDLPEASSSEYATAKTDYNYLSLSGKGPQIIYDKISEVIDSDSPQVIYFSEHHSAAEYSEAIEAYKNDHPETFWLLSEFEYSFDESDPFLDIKFCASGEELKKMKSDFEEKVNEIVSKAPENASPYEYEIYINNYLIDNCEYDKEAAESENIIGNESDAYGALVEGSAVCEGYSRAFGLLCNRLNIECVSVSGYSDEELHQWNCVKLDGEWYNVDVTWNDSDEPVEVSRYDYLNISDSDFSTDHKAHPTYGEITESEYESSNHDYNIFVPDCNGTRYNYFLKSCPELSDLDDTEDISQYIADEAKKGVDIAAVRVSSSLDFDDTYEKLKNGELYEILQRANEINGGEHKVSELTYLHNSKRNSTIYIELYYQ